MEEKASRYTGLPEGPFKAALCRLGENLSAAGYTPRGSADYVRVAGHFCYWYTEYASSGTVDESTMEAFLRHLPSCTCPVPGRGTYRLCHAAVSHLLAVLREMGLAPQAQKTVLPEDELLQAFQGYLVNVRGAVEASASLYARHVRPFLQSVYAKGEFRSVTAKDVETSVTRRAVLYKPKTVKSYCTSLRAFFRFLRLRGEIEVPLEDAVPAVPDWSLSTIPKYLRAEQVAALLSSFDVNTLAGLRNRAMALLMVTMGFRAGEVANLKMEDIDWRRSSMRLDTTKSRRIDYLPLTAEAGEALVAYLKRRPRTGTRHVFVNLATPVGRPLSSGVVSTSMRRAFIRCFPGEPSHGTHVLRHTLATTMLAKGATFKEIADILRHRNIETTAIYAKVDLKGLENATLPWPEVLS